MGILDSPLGDLASTLISTFSDNSATLVRTLESGYDPVSGNDMPPTLQSYSVKTTPPERYAISEIDNSTILKTDLRVFIAAKDLAVVPSSKSDTINLAGVVYNVIKVQAINSSADVVCLWELQLRA